MEMMSSIRVMTVAMATLVGLGVSTHAGAQAVDSATRFIQVATGYSVVPNVTYLRAGGMDLKLDLYRPRGTTSPSPVVVYFHGGGWTGGSKEGSAPALEIWEEMGWAVINVQYRLADVAHAPAAVEDCRCALRWVYRNAEQYNFDLEKIVVAGSSAGGHLALTTGMLPESAGLDRQCPGDRNFTWSTGNRSTEELKVAAIINWYGISDVVDLIDRPPGPSGNFTEAWLGSRTDREEVAKRVSPLTYVRPGLPPILTIHGDADPIVPHSHATRLHQALDEVGVPNKLFTVPGGGHGGFTEAQSLKIYAIIGDFLSAHDLRKEASNP
jgi:acetyl esterase/lipase